MEQVFIDNDIWIYLANGTYRDEDEILSHIEQLVDKKKIQLLVPDVLMEEWERNKQPKVRDYLSKILADRTKTLRELKQYLKEEHYNELNKVIHEVTDQLAYFQQAIEQRIERIENLLKHRRTIRLPIIQEVKLKAAEMALYKQMPFKKGKNSMGDALNFLTCVEYVVGTEKPHVHFITNNKHDFGKENNQSELHEDLVAVAKEKGVVVHYSTNIGEKLQQFGAFIKPETKKMIHDMATWGYNQYGIPAVVECCGDKLNAQHGIYINGNLYYRCLKCGRYYDSGISFD